MDKTDVKFQTDIVDYKLNSIDPIPSKIDLRDAHAIRRELAGVYRDMRAGKILAQDGTRFAYILDMIRKSYETAVLEERLELVEHIIGQRRVHL